MIDILIISTIPHVADIKLRNQRRTGTVTVVGTGTGTGTI